MFLSIAELEKKVQDNLAPLINYKKALEQSLLYQKEPAPNATPEDLMPALEKKLVDYFYQKQFHGFLEKILPVKNGVLAKPYHYPSVDDFLKDAGFEFNQHFWRLPAQKETSSKDEQDFLNQFALSFSLLRNAHRVLMGIDDILQAQQQSLNDARQLHSQLIDALSIDFGEWNGDELQCHFDIYKNWREKLRAMYRTRRDASLLGFTEENKFSEFILSLITVMAAKLEDGYNQFPDENWIYTSDWKNLVVEMISAIFSDKYHYEGWYPKTMAIISNTGLKDFFDACTQVCEQLPALSRQLDIALVNDARQMADKRLADIELHAANKGIVLDLYKLEPGRASQIGYFGGVYAGYANLSLTAASRTKLV